MDKPAPVGRQGQYCRQSSVISSDPVSAASSWAFLQVYPSEALNLAGSVHKETLQSSGQRKEQQQETDSKYESMVLQVSFRDVGFRYPTRPDVVALEGVSLDLPPGKLTAMVGLSGSGKSTMVALLQRLYDPLQGQVGSAPLLHVYAPPSQTMPAYIWSAFRHCHMKLCCSVLSNHSTLTELQHFCQDRRS